MISIVYWHTGLRWPIMHIVAIKRDGNDMRRAHALTEAAKQLGGLRIFWTSE
jgi:hypothetical protein